MLIYVHVIIGVQCFLKYVISTVMDFDYLLYNTETMWLPNHVLTTWYGIYTTGCRCLQVSTGTMTLIFIVGAANIALLLGLLMFI